VQSRTNTTVFMNDAASPGDVGETALKIAKLLTRSGFSENNGKRGRSCCSVR
jgi:hypothetical protein